VRWIQRQFTGWLYIQPIIGDDNSVQHTMDCKSLILRLTPLFFCRGYSEKTLGLQFKTVCKDDDGYATQLKGKGSPYSIAERSGADPGSWQSACSDVSHKPDCNYFPPGLQLPSQPLTG